MVPEGMVIATGRVPPWWTATVFTRSLKRSMRPFLFLNHKLQATSEIVWSQLGPVPVGYLKHGRAPDPFGGRDYTPRFDLNDIRIVEGCMVKIAHRNQVATPY